VFASGLAGCANMAGAKQDDFYFVQLSDTHWGFKGPALNPDADRTLHKAVAAVNALAFEPDFIVFTGDLTHTTTTRRREGAGSPSSATSSGLKEQNVRFMPRARCLPRQRQAWKNSSAEHLQLRPQRRSLIAIDNVSDASARIGEAQLAWFQGTSQAGQDARIVVSRMTPVRSHAAVDWATRDGAQAIELSCLQERDGVLRHIHQEHHHVTGHIAHHSAKSLIFPLIAPGSKPKREPVPWDPRSPTGSRFRGVDAEVQKAGFEITEYPVIKR